MQARNIIYSVQVQSEIFVLGSSLYTASRNSVGSGHIIFINFGILATVHFNDFANSSNFLLNFPGLLVSHILGSGSMNIEFNYCENINFKLVCSYVGNVCE